MQELRFLILDSRMSVGRGEAWLGVAEQFLLNVTFPFSHLSSHPSSYIVGFINGLSRQLSSRLPISGNSPHGKLVQLQ